jgi:fumarate reductase flavoprotein subunit
MVDDLLDSELIVVGAGIAGLMTSVRASEQGVRVKAGLPRAALERTIAGYNGVVHDDALERPSPVRRNRAGAAMPIAMRPFYAVPACAGITCTIGGIATDAEGSTAAGRFGNSRPLCDWIDHRRARRRPNLRLPRGLLKAVAFALRAADHISSRHSHRESGG